MADVSANDPINILYEAILLIILQIHCHQIAELSNEPNNQ